MKKTNFKIVVILLVLVIFIISSGFLYLLLNPKKVEVPVEIPVEVPVEVKVPYIHRIKTLRTPEFRNPPIREYKPRNMQLMGILNKGEETLPLYGRQTRSHRDRYHYYTTIGGENLYPVPVTYQNNNCMENIGCKELYDNDSVNVTGKNGEYKTIMYRTNNFF